MSANIITESWSFWPWSFIEESEKVIQSGHIYTASFGDVCDVWLDVPLLVNTWMLLTGVQTLNYWLIWDTYSSSVSYLENEVFGWIGFAVKLLSLDVVIVTYKIGQKLAKTFTLFFERPQSFTCWRTFQHP